MTEGGGGTVCGFVILAVLNIIDANFIQVCVYEGGVLLAQSAKKIAEWRGVYSLEARKKMAALDS